MRGVPVRTGIGTAVTKERLRELTWAGCTPEQIGEAAGRHPDVIDALYTAPYISPETGRAILRAWRALMPPDVDEVAIERVLDGDYPGVLLTRDERREAVRILALSRHSNRQIAERIQWDERTVQRDVNYLGLAGHRQVTAG
jgi:hypothetical protein